MIIDTPNNVINYIPMLKANGVTGVIRYDDRFSTWKQIDPIEARAIANAGLQLGIVYEHSANPAGYALGYGDACYSLAMAINRGQPSGSAVYYAVDHDADTSEIRASILPYFAGIAQAHKENQRVHLRIGCYGSGLTNSMLLDVYPDLLPWITCSRGFAGSAAFVNANRQTLWQEACDRTLHGLDIDINVARLADWGQFIPFSAGPVPVPSPSPAPAPPAPVSPWPSNVGSQDGIASWYSDSTNADMTPVNNATDMTCAHRYLAFGTLVKATRRDTGQSVVVGVHDRGPYAGGRIIDMRPAAARALTMIDAGIVPIHLEISL
jgi:hypothetical protein